MFGYLWPSSLAHPVKVANALPPLLAKAIAEEIKTVIVKSNLHLVNTSPSLE